MTVRPGSLAPFVLLAGLLSSLSLGVLCADQPSFADTLAAAQKGDALAQDKAGAAYLYGDGIPKDYAQALAWFQKAADQGNPVAESSVGWIYDQGLGVPADAPTAFKWYLASAKQGDAYGQTQTGEFYHKGRGTAQDDTQAASWFAKAALQGNLLAQTRLGIAYLNGTGVAMDPKQAFNYFLHAAFQNYGWAQYNVARCYYLGIFVPRDLVQSYKWCQLAQQSYHEQPVLELSHQLTTTLTVAQLSAGDELVLQWPREQWDIQDDLLSFAFTGGSSAKFPFDYVSGHILVRVKVQSHGDLSFLVDTGAPSSCLDEQAASTLGINDTVNYRPAGGIGQELSLSSIVKDIPLALPGLTFPKTSFTLISLTAISQLEGRRLDGIIGFDLLKHFVVRIDYVNKTIEFIDPHAFTPDPAASVVPLTVYTSAININATITNNGAESAIASLRFDTGSDEALVLNKTFTEANPNLKLAGGLKTAGLGIGGGAVNLETSCSQLQIGDIILPNPVVSIITANQGWWVNGLPGMIGNDILHRFDLTIDIPDKKLFLKKNSFFGNPYEASQTGLSVQPSGPGLKTLVILDVLPDSPAARAGFQPGDILLKIDDHDLKDLTAIQSRDLFRAHGKHRVVISRASQAVSIDFLMENTPSTVP